MKKVYTFVLLILCAAIILSSCSRKDNKNDGTSANGGLGTNDDSFGTSFDDLNIYDSYFEDERNDIRVEYISGTKDAWTLDGNLLLFNTLSEDSVYAIYGSLSGCIVVDAGEYKLDIELRGVSIVSDDAPAITALSADKLTVTAKKDYNNYLYDTRAAIAEDDDESYRGAIHAECDLKLAGKGALTVVSENNNGVHTKDDLEVKNLTLTVACRDNALKGNDSVTLESGNTTLIATAGDGIKTSNTDISDKGNQRGCVSVLGGNHSVYAACDGIDAAYDATVSGEETALNIYTDRYSNYSEEVTATSEKCYYIRFTTDIYSYSVKYYNSDSDYKWVDAEYHSRVSGGRSSYYYFSFDKLPEYDKVQFFIYSSDMEQSQDSEYLVASDYLTPHDTYDTFALSQRGGSLTYTWTNYTTNVQEGGFGPGGMGGPGGMNDGNTEKGDHSTKGIKAGNEIFITGGGVSIKSYDDALHADNTATLENGEAPKGNITVSGGVITLYSNDDGIHAEGSAKIDGGSLYVSYSYEALEGNTVTVSGGSAALFSRDDGINSTTSTGTGVLISGGSLYVHAGGDGIDSNSRSSYTGIVFDGGDVLIVSISQGNSAIDTEAGYSYSNGRVAAIMPSGGMSGEATHCSNFSNVACSANISLSEGKYLVVKVDSDTVLTYKVAENINGKIIFLGSTSADFETKSSTSENLNAYGINWN